MKLKLIGSKTCPFVQRCQIAFLIKKVSFETEFIDLDKKPEWFLKLSPTGKVPLVQINDNETIFESAVINEFLDKVIPPELLVMTPIQEAKNKSWIEFSSSLIVAQYTLVTTQEKSKINLSIDQLSKGFSWLETTNIVLPYFNSSNFSLIDIAFAPLFYRLKIINKYYLLDFYHNNHNLHQWSKNVLQHTQVLETISDEYEKLIIRNIKSKNGIFSKYFPDE